MRNLRIALRLLRGGFPDGAFFHCYHGFECAVSALIAAKGYEVPPRGKVNIKTKKSTFRYYPSATKNISDQSIHKVKLAMFADVADRAQPYYVSFVKMSHYLTTDDRNDALYYDPVSDRLPYQRYSHSLVLGVYQEVQKFISEIKPHIK